MTSDPKKSTKPDGTASSGGGDGSLGITLGIVFTGVLYGAVALFPHPWIQRYFLGHWVCVAATLLFSIAAGILLLKWIGISAESKLIQGLRDTELSPTLKPANASDQWLRDHHAGRVAKDWLKSLGELPLAAQRSRLVTRLNELLHRQSGRVSTRHLADDIRELSAREGDAAHDSLQLIRIIVWAIPMLGFLGTVVGITRTLGDLDFTNGDAAIENLKTGLYVAFDTTAMGLVLSVVAIFLQFPVERAETRLLGEIDRRVTYLLNAKLPSDDAEENPAGHIGNLCDGIRVAVAESLASQTQLWRQTIDEAHLHWQRIAEDNGQKIGDAIVQSLAPILAQHAQVIESQSALIAGQTSAVNEQVEAMRGHGEALQEQSTRQQEHINAIVGYTESLTEVHRALASDHQTRWTEWSTALYESTRLLTEHQQVLIGQLDEMMDQQNRAEQLLTLQSSLDTNLLRIAEASDAASKSIEANAGGGMSHAMMTLASAVEILAQRLPTDSLDSNDSADSSHSDESPSNASHDSLARRAA
jgi:biopolymer transport protein ExbB/TolQ